MFELQSVRRKLDNKFYHNHVGEDWMVSEP